MDSKTMRLRVCFFFAAALPLLVVAHSSDGLSSSDDRHSRNVVGSSASPPQWEVVSSRNFSSQIVLHPHILLVVTVPWCGESRSLMNEILQLIASKREELGHLKLMVLYKNSDRIFANVLGATEGITVLYSHYSEAYRYQGRLHALNILASVRYVMSLKLEDIPLKTLRTKEELGNFIQSTDRAILLLEFCGWAAKLSRNWNNGSKVHSENVDDLVDNGGREASEAFILRNQGIPEDLETEGLTCHVGEGPRTCPLVEEFDWIPRSASEETQSRKFENGVSCTEGELQQFESFFSKFTSAAREHFLPPERQRFGLVSDNSLLSFLGVSNPKKWLIFLQFSWCHNCSMAVHEVDDLGTIFQINDSHVMELDIGGRNSVPSFPTDRPSLILFTDRSSGSTEVADASKTALENFRLFAHDNHLSDQHSNTSVGSLMQDFSGSLLKGTMDSGHLKGKVFSSSKVVKVKDDVAIMIINEGENMSLDDAAANLQGNPAYDILTRLLQSKEPGLKTKENKVSLLAKKVGFELLSDDFEVQVVEGWSSQPKENPQASDLNENVAISLMDQSSKQPEIREPGAIVMNEEATTEHINVEIDVPQNQEGNPSLENDTKKLATALANEVKDEITPGTSSHPKADEKICQLEGLGSSTCLADNHQQLIHESPLVEEFTRKEHVDLISSTLSTVFSDGVSKHLMDETSHVGFVEDVKVSTQTVELGEPHKPHRPFLGSFFFSDGGYQLLGTMTTNPKMPSLVILDPALQQHYVLSDEENITYSSIVNFVHRYLNGSLTPYHHSEPSVVSSREAPRPPFLNLDFHETDSIPRVTARTFCEVIRGFKHCERRNVAEYAKTENIAPVHNVDVLVLFSTTWCGFCQRMELIVREVYRAFKSFRILLKNESQKKDSMNTEDNKESSLIELPTIYMMDCTLNDCGSFLKPLGKERYPTILLFPAGHKDAIPYEGSMSVVNIIEFLISHGSNPNQLQKHGGLLHTHTWKASKSRATLYDESSLEDSYNEFTGEPVSKGNQKPAESQTSVNLSHYTNVVPGFILTATEKLFNAFPFNNSTVLIVTADQNRGFEGLILNKRISWNIFKEFSEESGVIKLFPLSYGGPVVIDDLPLVSLTQKAREGYTAVHAGLYFGNPLATALAIRNTNLEEQSTSDYWFFLGYSSWGWNQLFDELVEGAWHLSDSPFSDLEWPYS